MLTYFTIVGSLNVSSFSHYSFLILSRLTLPDISLIGAKYWDGLYIVPVILLAYLFNGFYVVFSAGIYIEEKSIYAPIVTGVGALQMLLQIMYLFLSLNIMGAALATLLSYVVMALGYYIVTQKFYKINYDYFKLVKIVIAHCIYWYCLLFINVWWIFKYLL